MEILTLIKIQLFDNGFIAWLRNLNDFAYLGKFIWKWKVVQ